MNTRQDAAGVSIEEMERVRRQAEDALTAVSELLARLRELESGASS